MQKSLVILGRQPEFGLIELESLFGGEKLERLGKTAALVDGSLKVDRLGGAIKVGAVIYDGPDRPLSELPITLDQLPLSDGKTQYAVSLYGGSYGPRATQAVGLSLKKRLRAEKHSVRLIAPKSGSAVSAAELKFNQVLKNGFELLIVQDGKRLVIALTSGVQDVDWYSQRDYERPSRSARVGMLPPKLAQIMVNTTTAPLVIDPFCGTGVVLQEALLLGRTANGSDLAADMVEASHDNLTWLANQRAIKQWQVAKHDARSVKPPQEPLAIVSEGYLGPNLSKPLPASQLDKVREELRQLYLESLRNWAGQIPSGTQVTITAPYWQGGRGLNLIDDLADLGYNLIDLTATDSTSLIYRRANQQVGRQLLILRKR